MFSAVGGYSGVTSIKGVFSALRVGRLRFPLAKRPEALFSVVVSPAASTTSLNERRKFRALPRDRSRRRVTEDLAFT